MSTSLNPYSEWLGIDGRAGQPNYYELLGIDQTASDVKAIAAAADRAASRVRSCRPGEHADQWAKLLDQIAAAKKCLTDPTKKQEYDRQLSNGSERKPKPVTSTFATSKRPIDPNMYPPGAVPLPDEVAVDTGKTELESTRGGSIPAVLLSQARPYPSTALPAGIDPQTPYSVPIQGSTAPMPYGTVGTPSPMATTPTGVPYLQPVENLSRAADPMAPVSYGSSPPAANAMPEFPPAAIPIGNGAGAMMAIPMAQPIAANAPAPPIATAPAIGGTSAASPSPESVLAVRPTLAAESSETRTRSGLVGPILVGIGAGVLLLTVFLIIQVVNSQRTAGDSDTLAQNGTDGERTLPDNAKPGNDSAHSLTLPTNEPEADLPESKNSLPPASPIDSRAASEVNHRPVNSQEKKPDKLQLADTKSPAPSTPTPLSNSNSSDSPTTVPAPAPKPTPDSKPTTSPPKVETPPEPPEMTKQELVKLGKAMQKAREAIGRQEFDLAREFLTLAKEMTQQPQHAEKIERLNMLLEAVQQYREAVVTSVLNLESGASFEVGKSIVGVVETARDKVTIRVAGQNRTYSIRDLPPGLAVVLAEQTLSPDDPVNVALKGAYVLTHPKSTPEELTKARGYLEQAASSSDNAKALLPILDDSYDLAKDAKESKTEK